MVLMLLSKLQDPMWTDERGYRPEVFVLDTDSGLNSLKLQQVGFLDLCAGEMAVDVFSEYDGDILFPARESLSSSDSTGTRGLCGPVEFGNLIQIDIDSRDIVLEWSKTTSR